MTRLAPSIAESSRLQLALALALDLFDALDQIDSGRVLVVALGPQAAVAARQRGWDVVPDPGSGASAAAQAGAGAAFARGAGYAAVVAADLPLISPAGLMALSRAASPDHLVLAPDRVGNGTNGVVTPSPDFQFAFGPDSFRRHARAASALRLSVAVVRTPGLAIDIDLPTDADLGGFRLWLGSHADVESSVASTTAWEGHTCARS